MGSDRGQQPVRHARGRRPAGPGRPFVAWRTRSGRCTGFLRRAPRLRAKVLQVLHGTVWPDLWRPWIGRVRALVPRLAADRTVLEVLPYSSLLLARGGVIDRRWVIDYQESVSPHLAAHPRRSVLHRAMQPRLAALERAAVGRAGGCWFTSEANRRAYDEAGLVPAASSRRFAHFFDPNCTRRVRPRPWADAPDLRRGIQ